MKHGIEQRASRRIGIDVGGTFTDFVLLDGVKGTFIRHKEPSVPEDPSRSVEQGLPVLIEKAGLNPGDIDLIVHGTTLGLNAIIQRRGAKLGLVVSPGNRGVLEIGRSQLANSFDLSLQKEAPLVPRRLVLETSARLNADGSVHAEATDEELDRLAQAFRAADVTAVTVLLLHSYANPDFERDVASRLAARVPKISVTAAASIWPESREFERCLVALINSYVQPLMESYLDLLERRIQAIGITAPIYITANSGGTLSLRTAASRPIDTILSGPASGVIAASICASAPESSKLVTVDMGGTSADMSIVQNGSALNTTKTHVGDFPIIVPVVDLSAIGAGGGSIVWVDPQGILKVGPQSAGASPGPVCYGRGGTEPTVTDCYLIAGFIDADFFLGGRMKLDVDAARKALEGLADRLGIDGADRGVKVAEAALRVATAVMSTEMTKNTAQRGEHIGEFTLVPFGGAGPTQANFLAEDCGMSRVVVPLASGTFCALGAILADVKRDYLKSLAVTLRTEADVEQLVLGFEALEKEAQEWIAREGSGFTEIAYEHIVDMRYAGQAYDLSVEVDESRRGRLDVDYLLQEFHDLHDRTYGFRDAESRVKVTALRLRVIGRFPSVAIPELSASNATEVRSTAKRRFYWNGEYHDALVFRREDIPSDGRLTGPAIVEQEDTTTVILSGWSATVDRTGNIILQASA